MNNILLISHDGFAVGAKKAAELILGEQAQMTTLQLTADNGIDHFRQALTQTITRLIADKANLVILSDLKNGSPYNCALQIIASHNYWDQVQLFSGMNLNLVLEMVMVNEVKLDHRLASEIIDLAKSGITEMNKTIWDYQSNVEEE